MLNHGFNLVDQPLRSFPAVDIVEELPEAYLAYPERLELGNRMAASALVSVVGQERPSIGGDFLEEISLWYSFPTTIAHVVYENTAATPELPIQESSVVMG